MEKLDAFTRYLGNCGLFHFFDAIQKWVLVFTGIIVFVLTIATVFLRYVLTMNVLGLDEIILLVIFWQYFIGAAQGSREDSQIKADMVSTVVKNKTVVAWCHLLARIIECGVIGVCIKWSINLYRGCSYVKRKCAHIQKFEKGTLAMRETGATRQ